MADAPVRRSHMISPFGPGAMLVAPDGTSLLAAGLDHWYENSEGVPADDVEEFKIEEWRLQRRLGVDHFRLPPDHRRKRPGIDVPNHGLKLPYVRFPRWHFCPWCRTLGEALLTEARRKQCPECQTEGRKRFMAQVPFVAMCNDGHIQDFPWREWVHQSATPTCKGEMKLHATGGATLANQFVSCACKARRSLASITQASADGSSSYLSKNLELGVDFACGGVSPQHGNVDGGPCACKLRGSLRAASNVYFAVVRSAIYLPATTVATAPHELIALIRDIPDLINRIVGWHDQEQPIEAAKLKTGYAGMLRKYEDGEIEAAAQVALELEIGGKQIEEDDGLDEQSEEQFRRAEAAVLDSQLKTEELTVRPADPDEYSGITADLFVRVNLVERLRETRVLAGFDRVYPEQHPDREHRVAQLWRDRPHESQRWLPAYCVHGEGLFFRLDEAALRRWEEKPDVQERAGKLQRFYTAAQQSRQLRDRDLSPRFILIHTLAHILMNELTFECGYSSAALKERLYVSGEKGEELCALLIYTAAGDAEGTMGGLVRMGKPGNFENVLDTALRNASWCASDPVCMEIGSTTGQGPDSCNLAACHSCGLVPETACEEFNRFLDRGLVVGTTEDPDLGFFPFSGWED